MEHVWLHYIHILNKLLSLALNKANPILLKLPINYLKFIHRYLKTVLPPAEGVLNGLQLTTLPPLLIVYTITP